jgi:hypothetical protein
VLNPLFRDGCSYEEGCSRESWISGEWHFPLIACKYDVTIVVYSSSINMVAGEERPRLEKQTLVFKPNGQQEWLSKRLEHPRALFVDIRSTVFLVHLNGIHYLHMSVPLDTERPDEDESLVGG